MNLNTRAQVRHRLWQCFTRSADALFELADALMSHPGFLGNASSIFLMPTLEAFPNWEGKDSQGLGDDHSRAD